MTLTDREKQQLDLLRAEYEAGAERLDRYFQPGAMAIREKAGSLHRTKRPALFPAVLYGALAAVILLLTLAVLRYGLPHGWIPINEVNAQAGLGSVPDRAIPAAGPTGLIHINSASREELTLLPGIGPALAERIVESREKYGDFHFPEDLLTVSGIGQKSLTRILPLISFDIDEERSQ